MKNFLSLAALALAATSFSAAAHGPDKALHGGIVQTASDLSFELVPQDSGAALYVLDHGKPADISKMTGKLTVLKGTDKSEAEFKPAGPDKLEATAVKLTKGAKAVATLSVPGKQAITVRFTVR